MKYLILTFIAITLGNVSNASEDIAAANNCLACHKIDSQLVGPSYQDVVAKYKDQEGAADLLYESIKNGSTGTWGEIPMPPNASVADADIKALVDWILSM